MKSDASNALDPIIDMFIERVADSVYERLSGKGEAAPRIAPALLTVDEAAQYLARSRDAMDHLIRADRLKVVRDGRRVFIRRCDADAFIDGLVAQTDAGR